MSDGTNTLEGILEWVQSPPATSRPWLGFTGAFIFHACGFDHAFASVEAARVRSNILSRDPSQAPAGAFHWWKSPSGQAGIDLDGGGSRVLTVGHGLTAYMQGRIGVIAVPDYKLKYMGWSLDYGGQRIPSGRVAA